MPFLHACTVMYPNRMLKENKDFQYVDFLDSVPCDFVLGQGDEFTLFVFPKKGYNLIEPQIVQYGISFSQQNTANPLTFRVDAAGMANVPILGWVKLGGLSEHEAEDTLQVRYAQYYVDPLVMLNIVNKSVTVYRGSEPAARIVMDRPDMSVLQAIGAAGGIGATGKSAKVRVIRNGITQTMVQEIDLSDIRNVHAGAYYVKPDDVIYVQPGINPEFFRETAPILTAISSIVIIYSYFENISK